jgi:hypothetical protein
VTWLGEDEMERQPCTKAEKKGLGTMIDRVSEEKSVNESPIRDRWKDAYS